MQYIDLASQYKILRERIDQRISEVLTHGQYIMGPEVTELEQQLSKFVNVKHAITCANGTDALVLALMALNVKQGDAVFCPTFTFFATAEAIAFVGATPVFVDSDSHSFSICPVDLEEKVKTIKTSEKLNAKAIVAVDLFGLPADYEAITKIANEFDLKVVEDAAQGFGGQIGDKKAGSFGDIATTSFFPAKPLGCYGDGGALFTNSDEYADKLRSLRVHGKGADKYDNIRIGMNSRLDTIQAAVLLEKLAVFPQEIINRNNLAKKYNQALSKKFNTPQVPENYLSSWAQYTLVEQSRDTIIAHLKANNIPSMVYYRTCMHQQSAFRDIKVSQYNLYRSEQLSQRVVSLPMHPYLDESDFIKIIDTLEAL